MNGFESKWQRLTTAARQAPETRDAVAPYGFATRIAARALGDEPGDGSAGNCAGGLDQHRQVVALGETPHKLANVVPGKGLQHRHGVGIGSHRHKKTLSIEQT